MLSGFNAVISMLLAMVVGWATDSRALMLAGAGLAVAAAATMVMTRHRKGKG